MCLDIAHSIHFINTCFHQLLGYTPAAIIPTVTTVNKILNPKI